MRPALSDCLAKEGLQQSEAGGVLMPTPSLVLTFDDDLNETLKQLASRERRTRPAQALVLFERVVREEALRVGLCRSTGP